MQDVDALAERLRDTEVLVLIRERTQIRAPLLERLPRLRLISQRSVYPHIDIDACTRLGVDRVVEPACRHAVLCGRRADVGARARGDAPDPAADGRAAGGHLADRRRAPRCAARRWASTATAASAAVVAGYGKAFGMNVLVWAREASRERARADGYAAAPSKAGVLRRLATWSRCTCGWSPATRGIVTAGRSRADEAVGAARQHQPRAADRARRAGRCAPRRAARHGGGRRLRGGAAARSARIRCSPWTTSSARRTSATSSRDEYEIQFADIFDQIIAYAAGTPINVVNPDVLH